MVIGRWHIIPRNCRRRASSWHAHDEGAVIDAVGVLVNEHESLGRPRTVETGVFEINPIIAETFAGHGSIVISHESIHGHAAHTWTDVTGDLVRWTFVDPERLTRIWPQRRIHQILLVRIGPGRCPRAPVQPSRDPTVYVCSEAGSVENQTPPKINRIRRRGRLQLLQV